MSSVAHRSETHVTPSRANFMLMVLSAILGFLGLAYVGGAIAYLVPRKGEGGQPQNLGAVSGLSFTAGVAGPFVYDATGRGDAQGVFAVQTGGDASTVNLVLEQTCRHLGCPVAWTAGSDTFNCPCHGSVYSKTGEVKQGPANAPLYKHSFYVKDGDLWVTGRQA